MKKISNGKIFQKPYNGAAFIMSMLLFGMLLLSSSFSCSKNEDTTDPVPDDTTTKPVTRRDVEVWMTRPDKTALLRNQVVALEFSAVSSVTEPIISVDSSSQFQTMDGFGFAMTGGSAYVINKLESGLRDQIIRELFSDDSGCIGISYVRISIGASDLDANVFSYDDLPAGSTDPEMVHFSLDPDRENLIPVLKKALTYNPGLKILGSPWSAPVWMKTNGSSIGGSLKEEFYSSYARYFVNYIQGMASEGIPIDAITIQNEPLNPNNNPSMYMTWQQQRDFIKGYLGPAFEQAHLNTRIVLYDHNCDHPEYAINILNDPDARKYIDGSGFHLYAGDISALTQVHNAYPEKNLYFTEQWVGGPSNFGPDMNWHMKNLIIGAPRNWSRNVLEWNLASDPYYEPHTEGGCDRCEGALTIYGSVSRNVSYYIVGHASKFVPSGSVRIGSNMVSGLPNVAFLTPEGKKVLIVLNDSGDNKKFVIRTGLRQTKASLDAGSVATYVWK